MLSAELRNLDRRGKWRLTLLLFSIVWAVGAAASATWPWQLEKHIISSGPFAVKADAQTFYAEVARQADQECQPGTIVIVRDTTPPVQYEVTGAGSDDWIVRDFRARETRTAGLKPASRWAVTEKSRKTAEELTRRSGEYVAPKRVIVEEYPALSEIVARCDRVGAKTSAMLRASGVVLGPPLAAYLLLVVGVFLRRRAKGQALPDMSLAAVPTEAQLDAVRDSAGERQFGGDHAIPETLEAPQGPRLQATPTTKGSDQSNEHWLRSRLLWPSARLRPDMGASMDRDWQPRRENYFVAHWRGHLSLTKSFWVNLIAPTALYVFPAAMIQTRYQAGHGSAYADIGLFLLNLPIWLWGAGGVLRSADRYTKRPQSGVWGNVASFIVLVQGVSTIVQGIGFLR